MSLIEQNAVEAKAAAAVIPMDVLTDYISYARKKVHPTLSDEAQELLINCTLVIELIDLNASRCVHSFEERVSQLHAVPCVLRVSEELLFFGAVLSNRLLRFRSMSADCLDVLNLVKCFTHLSLPAPFLQRMLTCASWVIPVSAKSSQPRLANSNHSSDSPRFANSFRACSRDRALKADLFAPSCLSNGYAVLHASCLPINCQSLFRSPSHLLAVGMKLLLLIVAFSVVLQGLAKMRLSKVVERRDVEEARRLMAVATQMVRLCLLQNTAQPAQRCSKTKSELPFIECPFVSAIS